MLFLSVLLAYVTKVTSSHIPRVCWSDAEREPFLHGVAMNDRSAFAHSWHAGSACAVAHPPEKSHPGCGGSGPVRKRGESRVLQEKNTKDMKKTICLKIFKSNGWTEEKSLKKSEEKKWTEREVR